MVLSFGTAGIRGPLGSGPDEMNPDTVGRVCRGIAAYLSDRLGGSPARVVVGRDARHGSSDFAAEASGTMADAGHDALTLPGPVPTPVLSYAVRSLDADVGIMVTASHNPATDNGLKVYFGGRLVDESIRGAQIAPPADADIEAWIHRDRLGGSGNGSRVTLDDEVEAAYIEAIVGLIPRPDDENGPRRETLRIALTPLHGVGGRVVRAVLGSAGFTDVVIVGDQFDPDPDFPTVPYPNPEERGAMDRVLALARSESADLAIALDPDADRCAAAFPADGSWTTLTGDELGCLLGERTATLVASGVRVPGLAPQATTLATTLVSSTRLSAIAARHGLGCTTTLTGFKWLSRVPNLAYAYEEALGYGVAPDTVRDKDGISAALVVAEHASLLTQGGRPPGDALDDLDRRYGVSLTRQVSVTTPSVGDASSLERLLSSPPRTLGGSGIASVEDGRKGLDGLPSTPIVRLLTESGVRILVRPSGTETKLKAYIEICRPSGTDDPAGQREEARDALDALAGDLRETLTEAGRGGQA